MLCFSSGKKTCNSGSPTVNVSADLKWTNKSNNKNVKTSKQNSLTLTAKSTSLSLKPKRLKKKLINSDQFEYLNKFIKVGAGYLHNFLGALLVWFNRLLKILYDIEAWHLNYMFASSFRLNLPRNFEGQCGQCGQCHYYPFFSNWSTT